MLDQVWVFKKNGVVLWSKTLAPINSKTFTGGSIVNHLIRTVLLEERAGASQVGGGLHHDNPSQICYQSKRDETPRSFSSYTWCDKLL
jgi:hypothetical protein